MTKLWPSVRAAGLIVGGLIALWIATGVTLDLTVALTAPELARTWWPSGVRARLIEGESLHGTASVRTIDDTRASLRDAVLREPVNTYAVSTLAALDEFRGDRSRSSCLFRLSETLSRRNVAAQYWLIQNAVDRGSVDEALMHYDRAMRVSNEARIALLPVLMAAASSPDVFDKLVPILANRPGWWKSYIEVLLSGTDAHIIAGSFMALKPDLRAPDEHSFVEQAIRRTLDLGDDRDAIMMVNRFEGVHGSVRPVWDPRFRSTQSLLPFGWALTDSGGIRAYRDIVPSGLPGLHIVASDDASGKAAEQLIGLAPGRHVLHGTAGGVADTPSGRPLISVQCRDGTPVSQFVLPATGDHRQSFAFTFNLPPTCTTQWIRIATAPFSTSNFWIGSIFVQ